MNKKNLYMFLFLILHGILFAESNFRISKVKCGSSCGIRLEGISMEKASVYFTDASSVVYSAYISDGNIHWKTVSDSGNLTIPQCIREGISGEYTEEFFDTESLSAVLYNCIPDRKIDYGINVLTDGALYLPENSDGVLDVFFIDDEKSYLLEITITNLIEFLLESKKDLFSNRKAFIDFLGTDFNEETQHEDFVLRNYIAFIIDEYLSNEANIARLYAQDNVFIRYYFEELFERKLKWDFEIREKNIESGLYESAAVLLEKTTDDFVFKKDSDFYGSNDLVETDCKDLFSFIDDLYGLKSSEDILLTYGAVVPDAEKVQAGDFIKVFNGSGLSSVYIVSYISEGEVYAAGFTCPGVMSKKISLKDILSENDSFFFQRVFPVKNFPVINRWNVMSSVRAANINCGKIYESDQTVRDIEWLCIPNTGEYLVCSQIKMDLVKSNRMPFVKHEFDKYFVRLSGAEDPDSKFYDGNGNYRLNVSQQVELKQRQNWEVKNELVYSLNKSAAFEVVFLDSGNMPVCRGSLIKKSSDGLYGFTADEENSCDVKMYFNHEGVLKYENGETVSIGIRPCSYEAACPGDEIKLVFEICSKDSGIVLSSNILSKTFRVYDKKMIWRANLYVDERVGNSKSRDWNDVHPWNAPCDENDSEQPWWWSPEWGFNNWNRFVFGTDFDCAMNALPRGNGMQVVTFAEYTSFRSKGTSSSVFNNVSYDYNEKDVHAWDSPFDFLYKLKKQNEVLRSHFKKIIQEKSVQDESDDVTESAVQQEIISEVNNAPGEFPDGNGNNIEGADVTVSNLAEWNLTSAPSGKWRFYWKESADKISSFIPGLGFLFHSVSDWYYDGNFEEAKNYLYPDGVGAGTDCIGMIVRAASYYDSRYRWLNYNNMTPDKAECDELSSVKRRLSYPESSGSAASSYEIVNWSTMTFDKYNDGKTETVEEQHGKYTKYVYKDDESPMKISVFKQKYEQLPFYRKVLLNAAKRYFEKVVPGDVIAYGSSGSMENNFLYNERIRCHIGVIADIDYEAVEAAESFADLGRAVNVLESVYGQLIFGSVKRNLVQSGAAAGRTVVENSDLSGSWFSKDGSTQRCWSIQRLLLK